ncbi:hypothetical protein [Anaerospora hongkongensis]|uniref:hypothetical protein n=1 Tax=Anaerospora hongkongensis TaxID=244830 RepID=UPI0028A224E2|nr:hypothetical protein [Anaerospora hongkongensis]
MIQRGMLLVILFCLLVAGAGCGSNRPLPQAGLTVDSAGSEQSWQLPAAISQEGEGNIFRLITGGSLNAPQGLELAAGGKGWLRYSVDIPADPDVTAAVRLQFLSTQGTGRIQLAALDQSKQQVAVVGWAATGQLPANTANSHWTDNRTMANYKGDWLAGEYRPSELLAPYLGGQKVAYYRLTAEAGQGQHVIITKFSLDNNLAQALQIIPAAAQKSVIVGDTVRLEADIVNRTSRVIEQAEVELTEPFGYGLSVAEKTKTIANLAPGAQQRLVWEVKALRPHSVNMNKPWQVGFAVNGQAAAAAIELAIADNRPGKIFYVMTEDLEAIDGAGYAKAWGNQNGWLEPKELTVQMVEKAERLNAIADTYGAKWTHYIAWPLVKAAEWADRQSGTGEWKKAAAAIEQSVRAEADKGHEYGIHMHSDYDPYLPGNVLSYNKELDGIWANHLRHGWSHSIASEGSFYDYASRTGILYAYQRIMDELASSSPQGQLVTTRVGSFDFGAGPESEAISTRAYRKVGLWGTSDADGNEGGITSGPYGREIYFAKPDDINSAAVDITQTGLVEFRPTPRSSIAYESQSAAVMNEAVDQGIAYFSSGQGAIQPGIHGIVGFTHAMFVMGEPDWKSLEQGQFAAIDSHLAYLKDRYVNQNKLIFATASEMVKAYLDYYTPEPVALYGQRLSQSRLGISEYAVEILGSDIPIDLAHPHQVTVKIPLYLRDSAYRAVILKNGEPVFSTWGLPTPYNDVQFIVDNKEAKYSLKVYHNNVLATITRYITAIKNKISKN